MIVVFLQYWLDPVKDCKNDFNTHWNSRNYSSNGDKLFALGCLIWICLCQFLIFPMFVIGQMFSRFFPLIVIIYYQFDVENVELLQLILIMAYTILLIAWLIAFIQCTNYYQWTNAVLPKFGRFWYTSSNDAYCYKNLNVMQKYYNIRCRIKYIDRKRREVVIEILGKDIGNLVASYAYCLHFDLKQLLDTIDQEFWEIKQQ